MLQKNVLKKMYIANPTFIYNKLNLNFFEINLKSIKNLKF